MNDAFQTDIKRQEKALNSVQNQLNKEKQRNEDLADKISEQDKIIAILRDELERQSRINSEQKVKIKQSDDSNTSSPNLAPYSARTGTRGNT